MSDRSKFTSADIVADVWRSLALPVSALDSLKLPGEGLGFASSYRVGPFAQATVALSALAAVTAKHASSSRSSSNRKFPSVTVPLNHAVTEFESERFLMLDGNLNVNSSSLVGGLHEAKDGWLRIHDGFPNHRSAALTILGLHEDSSREDINAAIRKWTASELEDAAVADGAVFAKLRSLEEWDKLDAAIAVSDTPIRLSVLKTNASPPHIPRPMSGNGSLSHIRVLDLSRVLAGPVAGRCLAAHGADVLWITSPRLPDLPFCDRDTARGKRTIQLDLKSTNDAEVLRELIKDADVFLQAYRPGALAALGFSHEELVKLNPKIVYASLCAWGADGPWKDRRGFDSIVQTASGINVAEAKAFGVGENRVLPCQALDHGSGYLLATGISTALYKRETEGGSWAVAVSLAATGKYLKSLGQHDGKTGFEFAGIGDEERKRYMETKESGFGAMKAVKHSAQVEGMSVGWDIMPKPLGSDEPKW